MAIRRMVTNTVTITTPTSTNIPGKNAGDRLEDALDDDRTISPPLLSLSEETEVNIGLSLRKGSFSSSPLFSSGPVGCGDDTYSSVGKKVDGGLVSVGAQVLGDQVLGDQVIVDQVRGASVGDRVGDGTGTDMGTGAGVITIGGFVGAGVIGTFVGLTTGVIGAFVGFATGATGALVGGCTERAADTDAPSHMRLLLLFATATMA